MNVLKRVALGVGLSQVVRERERDLFFASTSRVWEYGGRLRGNMSLRLQGVYLSACHGLSIYGTNGDVHELITQCV